MKTFHYTRTLGSIVFLSSVFLTSLVGAGPPPPPGTSDSQYGSISGGGATISTTSWSCDPWFNYQYCEAKSIYGIKKIEITEFLQEGGTNEHPPVEVSGCPKTQNFNFHIDSSNSFEVEITTCGFIQGFNNKLKWAVTPKPTRSGTPTVKRVVTPEEMMEYLQQIEIRPKSNK